MSENLHPLIIENFSSLRDSINSIRVELSQQRNTIDELNKRTLIPRDANRFDLIMAVLRENPVKTYLTIWLFVIVFPFDKNGFLMEAVKGFIGVASAIVQ